MSNVKKKPDLHDYMVTGTKEMPFYTKIGAAWENKIECTRGKPRGILIMY